MRLIDADALIKRWDEMSVRGRTEFDQEIMVAPSIDIVRCGECKWGKPYSDKQLECDALGLGGLKFPDDFCSYGQRNSSEKPNDSERSRNECL